VNREELEDYQQLYFHIPYLCYVKRRMEERHFVCSYNSQVVQPHCVKGLEVGLCFSAATSSKFEA
jgi:hypothetical protein